MESLVIALISLLLVLPIIYFLPLGFTRKGKLLILFCAFIVFIIGIAARTVMSVWQMGLVLILLAIGFSFLISKRFGTMLFLHTENSTGLEDKVIKFEIEDGIEDEIRSQIKPDKAKAQDVILEIDSPPVQEVAKVMVEEREIIDNQIEDDFVLENVFVQNEEPENTYEIPVNEENHVDDFDELLKEIEMELIENNSENEKDEEVVEESENTIEPKMIELDEIEVDDLNSAPPMLEEIDSLPVIPDEQPEEQSEIEEIPLIEVIDDEQDEIEDNYGLEETDEIEDTNELEETTGIEDIHELEETSEIEDNHELEGSTKIEDIHEFGEIEDIELIPSENEQIDEAENEHSDYEQDEVDAENEKLDIQGPNDVLKQQLFTTMISQIKLSRNKISNTQYEKLILNHLHPSLSDHDYYTFISLLIEHYIEMKQFDELSSLISQNMNRFEKYPVILQEIHYLLEEYCKI